MALSFLSKLTSRAQPDAPVAQPETTPAATVAQRDDLLDPERLNELKQVLPREAIENLIETFVAETDAQLPSEPVDPGACDATAKRVHKIAGSAAVLGAAPFHAALGATETALRAEDVAAAEAALTEAHALWAQTRARLRSLPLDPEFA